MQKNTKNGLHSGPYSFLQGVGWVPSRPRSEERDSLPLDLEEGESLEASSDNRISYSQLPYSARYNGCQGSSSKSSYRWNRHESQAESARTNERPDRTPRESEESHSWPRFHATHEDRDMTRDRASNNPYSRQSRSRSRSPRRSRKHFQDLFVKDGDINTERSGSSILSKVPSLDLLRPASLSHLRFHSLCRCPISDRCRCKPRGSYDCRILVPDFLARFRQKALDWQTIVRPLRGLPVSTQRVSGSLKKFANYFERLQGPNRRRHQIQRDLEDWVIDVQKVDFAITPEALSDSRVLPALDEFLSEGQQALRTALEISSALVEDLTFLFRKWSSGDLDNHPDRGLLYQRCGSTRYRLALDKSWKHFTSGNYYGAGHLVTGQRWSSRLHMRRDGAHDPPEAGISGSIKSGARSVVMGLNDIIHNQVYADRDMGEAVRYMGTERRKKTGVNTNLTAEVAAADGSSEDNCDDEAEDRPSNHTCMLIKSKETQNPVRLFRSSKFSDISPYTPVEGYRYDGVYTVRSYKLLDKERQIYRFNMLRVPGQAPLREYDCRTSELTPEMMERVARRKEAGRQYRERMRQAT